MLSGYACTFGIFDAGVFVGRVIDVGLLGCGYVVRRLEGKAMYTFPCRGTEKGRLERKRGTKVEALYNSYWMYGALSVVVQWSKYMSIQTSRLIYTVEESYIHCNYSSSLAFFIIT